MALPPNKSNKKLLSVYTHAYKILNRSVYGSTVTTQKQESDKPLKTMNELDQQIKETEKKLQQLKEKRDMFGPNKWYFVTTKHDESGRNALLLMEEEKTYGWNFADDFTRYRYRGYETWVNDDYYILKPADIEDVKDRLEKEIRDRYNVGDTVICLSDGESYVIEGLWKYPIGEHDYTHWGYDGMLGIMLFDTGDFAEVVEKANELPTFFGFTPSIDFPSTTIGCESIGNDFILGVDELFTRHNLSIVDADGNVMDDDIKKLANEIRDKI